eukprot:CAMPEP_0174932462 /NCGR_PEP_ID=MMETSP1355-20121228/35716_1 /TAXON_ID=464990 /ORGANISM="Hemiselmis tepida, Strain CCMP443" /LENGTH=94 /DNA_ID=CAMNT_0016178877 /DNA_START=128 /DNA_END=408 /DNA_ORIENTATION=+
MGKSLPAMPGYRGPHGRYLAHKHSSADETCVAGSEGSGKLVCHDSETLLVRSCSPTIAPVPAGARTRRAPHPELWLLEDSARGDLAAREEGFCG